MPSGKTVKYILYEVLQFVALVVPILVIMERFACLMNPKEQSNWTTYWLVVAVSIAYVTSVTLLVWVPLKYVILKQRRFITEISHWRPTALAYLILCTLPCFAILIAGSKMFHNHQNRTNLLYQVKVDEECDCKHFSELPVSLVLFSLICVDIIERIRSRRLTGKSDSLESDLDISGPVLTHLQQVTTVSSQLHAEEGQNNLTPNQPEAKNGSTSSRWQDLSDSPSRSTFSTRPPGAAYLYSSSSRPLTYSGPLHFLWKKDGRAEVFVEGFMFWLDTVEMVRVAGDPRVINTAWVFPIYISAFLSSLRMIITPHSSLLSLAGVALQDLPFFVIRVGLIATRSGSVCDAESVCGWHGFVTPLLYPLKNVLVTLTYIYFTWLTKLRIFQSQCMF